MIYLDNAATTRPDPAVLEAMAQAREDYGNASSVHRLGVAAAKAVEMARAAVAEALQVRPDEVVFTSGGTEANNLALKGVLLAGARRGHLVISAVEHPSVLEPARALQRLGCRLSLVGTDSDGVIDLSALAKLLTERTSLVSVMHANNETGALQPLAEIGRLCRRRGVLFHTDASQSFTKEALEPRRVGADLVTMSAHKIHGPKGVGALYVRPGFRLEPILHGGGQEGGLRSGTHNTAAILGFGAAVGLSRARDAARVRRLRDRLEARLRELVPGLRRNGPRARRVCGILSVTIPRGRAGDLLQALSREGVCASAGAACSAAVAHPSHVLLAMGLSADEAGRTLRLSLSRWTTAAEVESVARIIARLAQR
ncbi:MAG: cysteine desulfurase [Elusimicrobia bacterium]|nr:cysteine desulfurase [Elusimicrobiota bacterium]